ncbi:MAG: nucleotide excision repair endonuclease [Myxococcota bacterium]
MGLRRFDLKFGADLLRTLPETPAVYCFKDEAGTVLYVGKAKNARRRLAQYRNATRRKVHRKQRELVRVAHALEVELVASELEALLRENALIQAHRPAYNVDGAYAFLYPAIGTGFDDAGRLLLCLSSRLEGEDPLALCWHGCFRPRWRAREAFDALILLFGHIGHVEPRNRLPEHSRSRKGTQLVALRRIDPDWIAPLRAFLDGESDALLALLFDHLLERSGARSDPASIQSAFDALRSFHAEDARRLADARRRVGWPGRFVPQEERDGLFIRARGQAPIRDSLPPSKIQTSPSGVIRSPSTTSPLPSRQA